MARPTMRSGDPARGDRAAFAVLAVLLIAATAALVVIDMTPEWQTHQRRFRDEVERRSGREAAAAAPSGIQQVWIPAAGRADRCQTCHAAATWRGFEQAEEPLRTHPAGILRTHPVERFGCTLCHGGQGWAVDRVRAHGHVPDWPEPLLDTATAAALLPGVGRAGLMAMACNGCHRHERATDGVPLVNRAKQLVEEKGCRACHRINGRGGLVGPDLMWAGDKHPAQYDYRTLEGRPTVFAWHRAHFDDPRAMSADTVMPSFHLAPADVAALTVLVMSWRRVPLGDELLGQLPRVDPPDPGDQAKITEMAAGPGAWFVRTGCRQCHTVSVFGVTSPTPIGPDLSTAAEDVERRYGMPIETFLQRPAGTMKAVLARQFMLTAAQKQEAAQQLRAAFAAYQRQPGPGAAAGR